MITNPSGVGPTATDIGNDLTAHRRCRQSLLGMVDTIPAEVRPDG